MKTASTNRRSVRWARRLVAALALALGLLIAGAPAASAHVVPWTTVQLDVQDGEIDATLNIPLDDLQAATGIDLGDQTQADVDAHADQIDTYLRQHFSPTTATGQAWTVSTGTLTVLQAGDRAVTGLYQQVTTTVALTPPAGADERSFDLGYTAVVDKVITHVIVVTVSSDWAGGNVGNAYELGTIELDTASGTVPAFHVDLNDGNDLRGFLSMASLGVRHIQEGTDHQLFLLALLVPAPLLAAGRRWGAPATTGHAVRRILRITAAFTVGHSVTLALGALGLPVPQQSVEALIAVSIVVAAAHAMRPIFPGREALVAASFGLVHGLAFSETLRELHLSGTRLVLSLLGFNLGIEVMQLAIVALVLPPLTALARTRHYHALRRVAALTTGVAATGWFAARVGFPNPVATAADHLGSSSTPVVVALWVAGAAVLLTRPRPVSGRRLSVTWTDRPRLPGWLEVDLGRRPRRSSHRTETRHRPLSPGRSAPSTSSSDAVANTP